MIDRADQRRGSVIGLSGARYLAAILGLVTGPLMARALGPIGRGELASVTVYAAVATTVASMGVPLALSHAVAKRLYPRPAILAAAVRFSALLVLPSLLAAYFVVTWPLADLSGAARTGAFVAVALVPIGVLSSCLLFLLLGEGALGSVTAMQVAPVVVLAAATAVLYLTGWLTVSAAIAATVSVGLVGAVIGWRAVGLRPTGRVPFRPILSYGLRGFAGNVATFASITIDQAVIGPVLGTRSLGFYAVAASIASLPYVIGVAIGSRSFAEVAAVNSEQQGETVWRFMRLTLVVTLAAAAGVAILGPLLLPVLYGHEFEPSLTPLLVLLPGSIALSLSATASACLNATGSPGRSTLAELAGFLTTVVGLILVIPRYGIVGAAVLSTAAYCVSLAGYLAFLRRLGPVDLWPKAEDLAFLRAATRQAFARVSLRRMIGRR